jgi:hypothetical protein
MHDSIKLSGMYEANQQSWNFIVQGIMQEKNGEHPFGDTGQKLS